MPPASPSLKLAFDLAFDDLHHREGLERVDRAFARQLAADDAALHERWAAARAAPEALTTLAEAELLIAGAPALDEFVAELFGIEREWRGLVERHHELAPLF